MCFPQSVQIRCTTKAITKGKQRYCCWVAKSSSFWPHGLQHTRLLCPPLSPGVCSNSSPLSQWCHPTISSSVAVFSFWLQSFPASGSFPMSWVCIRWSEYWSFSFDLSSEYSGLISFRIDWFDHKHLLLFYFSFKIFVGVQLIYNVSFRCTAKWIGYTYTYILF